MAVRVAVRVAVPKTRRRSTRGFRPLKGFGRSSARARARASAREMSSCKRQGQGQGRGRRQGQVQKRAAKGQGQGQGRGRGQGQVLSEKRGSMRSENGIASKRRTAKSGTCFRKDTCMILLAANGIAGNARISNSAHTRGKACATPWAYQRTLQEGRLLGNAKR